MECSPEAFAMQHSMRGGWRARNKRKTRMEGDIAFILVACAGHFAKQEYVLDDKARTER